METLKISNLPNIIDYSIFRGPCTFKRELPNLFLFISIPCNTLYRNDLQKSKCLWGTAPEPGLRINELLYKRGYSTWKKLVRLKKLQCFLFFEILTCLTSPMHHHQSASIRIWDMPSFFVATNWSVRIYRVGAQMCCVSWKLNLSEKIPILKYCLTASYSKCIIWVHSTITLPQKIKIWTPHLHLFVLV